MCESCVVEGLCEGVWREYADPDDTSQEPPWGFSPRGKLAELVVRDAFATRWACDPWWRPAWAEAALTPGIYRQTW